MQKARLLTPSRFLMTLDSPLRRENPDAEFHTTNEVSTETGDC